MKTTYKLIFALIFIFSIGCDRFSDLNSDPSDLTEPDLRFSMTKAIEQMYDNDYTIWFYNNFQYIHPWIQVGTMQGGNAGDFNQMGPDAEQNIYAKLFPQTMDIRYRIDEMEEGTKETYQALRAMTFPIQIAPALTNTDNTGSLTYTEAGLAPYTNPPLLTPVVDNQETLFTTWLAELDEAIEGLTADNQFSMSSQDAIYGGDYTKWAKYCNLLKLRIAARLVTQNRTKALSIVEEVANSSVGYMDELNDDFIYRRNVKYFGTGNGMWIGYAGRNLVDFLLENKDPRVRFIFDKNDFNGEVVQAFIDAGKDLPPYIEPLVKYDTGGNFAGWEGDGEPWVRYHGAPVSPDATLDPANDIYFNQSATNQIENKSYDALSLYSEKLTRTSYRFTYPTKPGGRVIELRDNEPPHNVVLGSAAETNLYFAEFKLLGANLPKSAQEYLNWGVELSVKRADKLAENQQMPYYNGDPVYTNEIDADAAATKLRDGEIAELLSHSAYDLSIDALEKVYIQQYINFMNTPNDLWTLVRRSGIPKKGSAYLPWENFTLSDQDVSVPRRFVVDTPTEDDLNFANKKASIDEQGFTSGTNSPSVLESERLWFDENNPAYGAGPNN
ncbi:SusD/RagB family nutrient-binding outer membrane lipoprotein [Prolixibacteraceae bacterium Z1-6]|uniref:SusD/RagB family nutrient-binding outer membrane lipoprotein n=1 Tax=Draconibacterium aestuarii TaxID=2998507 RepID=A0A9X3FHJ7_9BACT|nr:SusD/RagB family nutrient-binding outer membrane lipoprotein [Prolixibacteraceae bacterium Z1-6]